VSEEQAALLPHGARGLEFCGLVVELRPDKIVFLSKKEEGDHYTLHLGLASGLIDLHRTWRDSDGAPHHETIFAILRDELPALLGDLSGILGELMALPRPLRLGWLAHNRIGVVGFVDEARAMALAEYKPQRRRLVLTEQSVLSGVKVPEFLDEIWDFPDGVFFLYRRGQMEGLGLKFREQRGGRRLWWLKRRELTRAVAKMGREFRAAAERHAIPRDQYWRYPVLCAGGQDGEPSRARGAPSGRDGGEGGW
jgi:hypothetical protein